MTAVLCGVRRADSARMLARDRTVMGLLGGEVGGWAVGSDEGVDAGLGAADQQLLDLAGAFVEGHHAGVAEVLRAAVLLDVAGAAVDLDAVVGGPHGGLGGEELGLGRGGAEGLATVDEVGAE